MNYRHAFHAGNFADVFKHSILVALIQSLLRKETGFCYLETHAGIGFYDLLSDATQIRQEFKEGIEKVLAQQNPPSLLQDYLHCVKKINDAHELRYYPGSPYFVREFLRTQDRMILSELHPDDFQTLKKLFRNNQQIAIHQQDGYQNLKAFLPPKERRGLVLIDPAYEKSDELAALPGILSKTLERWETGIYALWYPIKTERRLSYFRRDLKNKIKRPMLSAELCIYSEDVATELNGCGMLIINPPWQFEQQLKIILPWLWKTLSMNGQGRFDIQMGL